MCFLKKSSRGFFEVFYLFIRIWSIFFPNLFGSVWILDAKNNALSQDYIQFIIKWQ